jgi:hypothetical protein
MQILMKILLISIFSVGLAACERQGPMERTGESIDETFEDIGDSIDNRT